MGRGICWIALYAEADPAAMFPSCVKSVRTEAQASLPKSKSGSYQHQRLRHLATDPGDALHSGRRADGAGLELLVRGHFAEGQQQNERGDDCLAHRLSY